MSLMALIANVSICALTVNDCLIAEKTLGEITFNLRNEHKNNIC